MRLAYDNEADALAITLREGLVERTHEVEPGTLVDVDVAGNVLVIEIVGPSRRWPLDKLLKRFPIDAADAAVLRGMQGGDPVLSLAESAPLAVT